MNWVKINSHSDFPKTTSEFLTRNDNQGGTLELVYYDRVHNCFRTKGNRLLPNEMGTHYCLIFKDDKPILIYHENLENPSILEKMYIAEENYQNWYNFNKERHISLFRLGDAENLEDSELKGEWLNKKEWDEWIKFREDRLKQLKD